MVVLLDASFKESACVRVWLNLRIIGLPRFASSSIVIPWDVKRPDGSPVEISREGDIDERRDLIFHSDWNQKIIAVNAIQSFYLVRWKNVPWRDARVYPRQIELFDRAFGPLDRVLRGDLVLLGYVEKSRKKPGKPVTSCENLRLIKWSRSHRASLSKGFISDLRETIGNHNKSFGPIRKHVFSHPRRVRHYVGLIWVQFTGVACDYLHFLIGQLPAGHSAVVISAQWITDYDRLDPAGLVGVSVTVIVFHLKSVDDYPMRIVLAHCDDRSDASEGDCAD